VIGRLTGLLAIILIALLYASYEKNQIDKIINSTEAELTRLPVQFSYKNFNSDKTESIDLQAPGVFVHFWATWCAPCKKEFPLLEDLISEYNSGRKRNLKFYLIATNDQKSEMTKFLKGFKFPENVIIGMDNEGKTLTSFNTAKLPETFLFDDQGTLVQKLVGPQDWSQPYFLKRLNSLFP